MGSDSTCGPARFVALAAATGTRQRTGCSKAVAKNWPMKLIFCGLSSKCVLMHLRRRLHLNRIRFRWSSGLKHTGCRLRGRLTDRRTLSEVRRSHCFRWRTNTSTVLCWMRILLRRLREIWVSLIQAATWWTRSCCTIFWANTRTPIRII